MPDLFGLGSEVVFAKTDPTEPSRSAPPPAAPAVFKNSRRLTKMSLFSEPCLGSLTGEWRTFLSEGIWASVGRRVVRMRCEAELQGWVYFDSSRRAQLSLRWESTTLAPMGGHNFSRAVKNQ